MLYAQIVGRSRQVTWLMNSPVWRLQCLQDKYKNMGDLTMLSRCGEAIFVLGCFWARLLYLSVLCGEVNKELEEAKLDDITMTQGVAKHRLENIAIDEGAIGAVEVFNSNLVARDLYNGMMT